MSVNLRLLIALLWTLGILVATTVPASSVPDVDAGNADKLVHFAMFFGFGWFWMWAVGVPLRRRFLYVAAAGVIITFLSETLQGLMGLDRAPEALDIVANLSGLFTSTSLYLFWHRTTRAEEKCDV